MKKTFVLIILLYSILAFSQCSDCNKACGEKTMFNFEEGSMSKEIPFENTNNIISVKVRVNDKDDIYFIFDTGATYTVIDSSLADKLNLELGKRVSDSKKEYTGFSKAKFSFSGVDALNQEGRVSNIKQLSQYSGQRIDGILGYDFIKDFVVEINYEKKYLKLHSPKNYLYGGKGEKMKLEIRKKWPVGKFTLKSSNSEVVDTMLIFDSGSIFSFSLNFTGLADKSQKSTNSIGIAGVGPGGSVGRLKEFEIAGIKVSSPLCAFPADDNPPTDPLNAAIASVSGGIIGGQLMRKFNFVFDYSGGNVYIEKNSNFDEKTEFDMSGLFLICDGESLNKFVIAYVSDSSAASEAGLQTGDKIKNIGGKDASEMSLWEIKSILSTENNNLEIKTEREGKIITSVLKLKRML